MRYELYGHFYSLARRKTAVFISHRLSSTRFCDRIAVFQDGRIVQVGPHDALMQTDGLYAQLYRMQAKHYQ